MSWHYKWTNSNNALSSNEKYENAYEIWCLLTETYGWSQEATAATIANFESEGALNPGQWQYGKTIGNWDSASTGLGLGQWTPPSKLAAYFGDSHDPATVSNGEGQVKFTVENTGQWSTRLVKEGYYDKDGPFLILDTLSEYSINTSEPEVLAGTWAVCWERPSARYLALSTRQERARKWYNAFADLSGHPILFQIEGNGKADASVNEKTVTSADEGDFVTIWAQPNDDDEFLRWEIISGISTLLQPLDHATNNFTMPNNTVTIKAYFTGDTPEPPEPPEPKNKKWRKKSMPWWIYSNTGLYFLR